MYWQKFVVEDLEGGYSSIYEIGGSDQEKITLEPSFFYSKMQDALLRKGKISEHAELSVVTKFGLKSYYEVIDKVPRVPIHARRASPLYSKAYFKLHPHYNQNTIKSQSNYNQI